MWGISLYFHVLASVPLVFCYRVLGQWSLGTSVVELPPAAQGGVF